MRIRVCQTFVLDEQQVQVLAEAAQTMGFDFDGTTSPNKLINRLLLAAMENTITRVVQEKESN